MDGKKKINGRMDKLHYYIIIGIFNGTIDDKKYHGNLFGLENSYLTNDNDFIGSET